MQTRLRIATAAGAGLLLLGSPGLALAASGDAAPTPAPTTPSVSLPSTVPPSGLPGGPAITSAPATAPVGPGSISVPAGNANSPGGGPHHTWLVIGLAGAGVLLAAGGTTVVAARYRRQ